MNESTTWYAIESVKELILEVPSDFPINEEGVEIALLTPGNGKAELTEQRTPLQFEPVADENDLAATGTHRLRVSVTPAASRQVCDLGPLPNRCVANHVGRQCVASILALAGRHSYNFATRNGSALQVAFSFRSGANADASSWKASDPLRKKNAAGTGYEFVTDRAEPLLPLLVSAADANTPSTTVVDRVWLQTWISGGIEQDRAAFHLRSSNSQATVELPPDAPSGEVEVLVDGQPAQVSSRAAGRIVVRLVRDSSNQADAAAAEPTTHTLEVRFRRPFSKR